MNVLDVMFYGNRHVIDQVRGLTDEQWQAPNVCGWWSSKDILSHLTSFEWLLVDVLRRFVEADAPADVFDRYIAHGGQAFNDAEIPAREGLAPAAVMAEYQDAHDQVMAWARQIPAETFRANGLIPWYGVAYDLEDLVTYQYYGHKREHLAQIAVYLDTLKGQSGRGAR
jgi:hypothetical protein